MKSQKKEKGYASNLCTLLKPLSRPLISWFSFHNAWRFFPSMILWSHDWILSFNLFSRYLSLTNLDVFVTWTILFQCLHLSCLLVFEYDECLSICYFNCIILFSWNAYDSDSSNFDSLMEDLVMCTQAWKLNPVLRCKPSVENCGFQVLM